MSTVPCLGNSVVVTADRLELATLMYHEVTDDPSSSGFQRPSAGPYRHALGEFRAQLQAIGRGGLRPERIDGLKEGGRHLLLTFDDGGRSALDAADILESCGWYGHFFVVTGLLGARHFLSRSSVRELHGRGHLVGSHSHTHPDVFRALSRTEMIEEWARSRAILEDLLGARIVAASIPGGDGDAATERSAAAAGYRYLFTSEPRLVPWCTKGMLCIGRACLKAGVTPEGAGALARGQGFGRELALWKAKSAARTMLRVVKVSRSSTLATPG